MGSTQRFQVQYHNHLYSEQCFASKLFFTLCLHFGMVAFWLFFPSIGFFKIPLLSLLLTFFIPCLSDHYLPSLFKVGTFSSSFHLTAIPPLSIFLLVHLYFFPVSPLGAIPSFKLLAPYCVFPLRFSPPCSSCFMVRHQLYSNQQGGRRGCPGPSAVPNTSPPFTSQTRAQEVARSTMDKYKDITPEAVQRAISDVKDKSDSLGDSFLPCRSIETLDTRYLK